MNGRKTAERRARTLRASELEDVYLTALAEGDEEGARWADRAIAGDREALRWCEGLAVRTLYEEDADG